MKTKSETTIAIANKLYEARRSLRWLMGESYAKHAVKWMALVESVAYAEGEELVPTCIRLMADAQEREIDSGMACLWLMAATVELIEPDELTPKIGAEA